MQKKKSLLFNSKEIAMASDNTASILYLKDNEHSWAAQSIMC